MNEPTKKPNATPESERRFAELIEQISQTLERGEWGELSILLKDHPEHEGRVCELLPMIEAIMELAENGPSKAPEMGIEGRLQVTSEP